MAAAARHRVYRAPIVEPRLDLWDWRANLEHARAELAAARVRSSRSTLEARR